VRAWLSKRRAGTAFRSLAVNAGVSLQVHKVVALLPVYFSTITTITPTSPRTVVQYLAPQFIPT
jgi:hypothetical protein